MVPMKALISLIALLFVTGCSKENSPLKLGVVSTNKTGKVWVVAGQSNSVYMHQRESELISNTLGGKVVCYGVPSTQMSRWTVGGDLYRDMTNSLNLLGENEYVAGLIFWQGESDAGTPDASAWPTRFESMVNDFRVRYGSNIRVVYAQITDTGTPGRDDFRDAQARVVLPNVKLVSSDGILKDGDHTNSAGYHEMAMRFVGAF